MLHYINSEILKLSKDLKYIVRDEAPNTEGALFNQPSLVIWSGESENTIYQDAAVNYAFRAIHDNMHLKTGLGFKPEQEIEMGRIQAAKLESDCKGFLAGIFYIEIAEQARYYLNNGVFVPNQIEFTLNKLTKLV